MHGENTRNILGERTRLRVRPTAPRGRKDARQCESKRARWRARTVDEGVNGCTRGRVRSPIIAFLCLLAFAPFFCSGQSTTNLWTFHLAEYDGASSPAVAPDGTIYVGNYIGDLFAITPDGKVKWKFQAGLEIKSSPAVAADGTVYFGSRDRRLYALTPGGS